MCQPTMTHEPNPVLLVSVKFAWDAAMLLHFHRIWLLLCHSGSIERLWQRPYGLQSPEYLLSSLIQKEFANPGVAENLHMWSGFMTSGAFLPYFHFRDEHIPLSFCRYFKNWSIHGFYVTIYYYNYIVC